MKNFKLSLLALTLLLGACGKKVNEYSPPNLSAPNSPTAPPTIIVLPPTVISTTYQSIHFRIPAATQNSQGTSPTIYKFQEKLTVTLPLSVTFPANGLDEQSVDDLWVSLVSGDTVPVVIRQCRYARDTSTEDGYRLVGTCALPIEAGDSVVLSGWFPQAVANGSVIDYKFSFTNAQFQKIN